jgi:hypothetical protein
MTAPTIILIIVAVVGVLFAGSKGKKDYDCCYKLDGERDDY